ncbi:MAG: argininosuccinate lyase, partial [bacterium]|nr:argininosuccinate lyase [bacterium]
MKLWAGRFEKQTDSLVEDFHSSISFDSRLYRHDLLGSIAHAKMLASCHIITAQEGNVLIEGLKSILAAIESGEVEISTTAEDIHTNMEALLIERVGEVGKKLHTARSRNDQVSLDTRMFLKAEIEIISSQLLALEQQLLQLASQHLNTVMPGYTHLQKAQPITLAHHFMAYFQMFRRDIERLQDCYKRVDVLPLGSGALAGTTFPIDRQMVATELGFSSLSENSLDAVSDRDFIIEFIAAASILMMHLSRFCEELILWYSDEFKFVEMDDAYSTGSSIMPQKKNPDVAELIRGKTGRVYGDLIAVLSMMKSLPLAYNKDMQEDKEALFDAVDTVKKCLMLFTPMIITMKINAETMRKGAESGFANATDVADYLAKKGVAFRNAHEIVGHLVLYCIKHKKDLSSLSLAEYKQFCPDFDEDIFAVISIDTCVDRRCVYGGPAALAVRHS